MLAFSYLASFESVSNNYINKQTNKASKCLLQSAEWPVSSQFVFYLVFLITLILWKLKQADTLSVFCCKTSCKCMVVVYLTTHCSTCDVTNRRAYLIKRGRTYVFLLAITLELFGLAC